MKRLSSFLMLPVLLVLSGCQMAMPTKEDLQRTTAKVEEIGRSTVQVVKEGGEEKARSTKESVKKSAGAVAKSFEGFTPEQEYYIGRSVAAVLLAKYAPLNDQALNEYLNLLGQTLAQASDMPEVFNGYRFLALDSDEVNAFATPGGHVFVTQGLLRCCPNEDAVAAVLAHEIGHIQLRHGIQAIKKTRITEAIATIATETVKVLSPVEIAELTESFSGAVFDVAEMINNGYSRAFEYAADDAAVTILRRVGYDPNALVEMLMMMETHLRPDASGIARTHPAPADRIEEIRGNIGGEYAPVQSPSERQARFAKAVAKI